MSSKPKILVNLVKKTLERKGIDYEKEINNFGQIQAVKSRIDDKIFSLKEHIKGLVYSLLSKQRIWKSLVPNIKKIDSIFYFYNPEKLISVDPKRLIEKIVEIKCGNMLIKKQILTLKDNIKILKRLSFLY